jgi:CRISPR-associated endonuclease/helicase Cas3
MHTHMQSMHARMQSMHAHMQSMHVRMQSMHVRMQSMHTRMQSMHTRMQSMHTRMQSMHTRMQSMHTRMQSMHARMQSMHACRLRYWQMQITTLPVYSKLADESDVPAEITTRLPQGWQLSQHQLETYRALINPAIDVVINTAMTGDGKSLAAYLPTLVLPDHRAFGMYPTIELSRDQERQFTEYCTKFGRTIRRESLWGAKLGERVEQYPHFKRRGEALAELFNNYQVLLTNPDIFNLVMNYHYGSGLFSSQELPYSLATNFNNFIFDEFHIFTMPQIIAALTAMVFFRCYRGDDWERPRFLFSSATTDPTLLEIIQRSGLTYRIIRGVYANEPTPGYRPVLHPASLAIHQCGDREDAEQWIAGHLDLIAVHWIRAGTPRPKGVIIVNSVALARRIVRLLEDTLNRIHGITIGENSGLVDDARRAEALRDRDIVVGTSTIDVGVDFNISFLIFESTDGGSFLQRLGRLGRVRRDELPFEHYEAHALMSGKAPWITEKLVQELDQRGIKEGDAIDRATVLREVVGEVFPTATNFQRYAKRWGALQSAHVIATLEDTGWKQGREGGFDTLAQTLRQRYAAMFKLPTLDNVMKRYWVFAPTDRKKKADPERWAECKQICDEILGFRGSSPFQIGMWDASITPPAFLTYDALSLLSSATYTISSIANYTAASGMSQRTVDAMLRYTMKGKGDTPLVLRIERFNAERAMLKLTISGVDMRKLTQQILVLSQLAVIEPRSEALSDFNVVLKRQEVVCYISSIPSGELRRRLHLPPFFPLYSLIDQRSGCEYAIAFGKSALLLEAEALVLRDKDPDTTPIFL